MEETYMQYLIKSYKKTLSDNLYDFIIVDCNNNSLRSLNEFYCNAKDSNFVVRSAQTHTHTHSLSLLPSLSFSILLSLPVSLKLMLMVFLF